MLDRMLEPKVSGESMSGSGGACWVWADARCQMPELSRCRRITLLWRDFGIVRLKAVLSDLQVCGSRALGRARSVFRRLAWLRW